MNIRLKSYRGSKIGAIKSLRNAVDMDLLMAKNVCEGLPVEVAVQSGRINELQNRWEYELCTNEKEQVLRRVWDGLPEAKQNQLLQYLSSIGILCSYQVGNANVPVTVKRNDDGDVVDFEFKVEDGRAHGEVSDPVFQCVDCNEEL